MGKNVSDTITGWITESRLLRFFGSYIVPFALISAGLAAIVTGRGFIPVLARMHRWEIYHVSGFNAVAVGLGLICLGFFLHLHFIEKSRWFRPEALTFFKIAIFVGILLSFGTVLTRMLTTNPCI